MQPDTKSVQAYQLGFVLILICMLLFVMFMTSRQQGVTKFEENFFQQDLLIENFNHLRLKMGDRVFNEVLLGENGWMEFTGDGNLDDYQNPEGFGPIKLERFAEVMQACYKYTRAHNITFLVVVAPNKASIYPDKVPEQIQPLSDLSRLDQLNQYLRAHDIPEVLDLRPALRDARQEHEVYNTLGTHWNMYGAYIAYQMIIHALSQSHPELAPYPAEFFRFRNADPGRRAQADIARLIEANYLVTEPSWRPMRDIDGLFRTIDFPFPKGRPGYHKVTWIPGSNLPSLLMYHDSFGNSGLNQYLALNFSKAFYVHRNSAAALLNRKTIEQFAPDVMMYQVVERNLHVLPVQLSGCKIR